MIKAEPGSIESTYICIATIQLNFKMTYTYTTITSILLILRDTPELPLCHSILLMSAQE